MCCILPEALGKASESSKPKTILAQHEHPSKSLYVHSY